jgi:ElaB/YqjD/DUF883 family membrane-anchored ribosome-binding protein
VGKRPSELNAADPVDPAFNDDTLSTDEPVMTDAYAEASYVSGPMDDTADGFETDSYVAEYGDETDTTNEPDLTAQREQIERTRADMSEKLDAIQSKLSPGNLTNQAKEAVRDATIGKAQHAMEDVTSSVGNAVSGVTGTVSDTASDWGGSVFDVIRENPIPAALAGAGIGWLVMSFRKHQSSSNTDRMRGYTDRNHYSGGTPYVEAETRYPYRDYRNFNNQSLGAPAYGAGGYSAGSGADSTMQNVQGKVGDMASQAQDTAGQIANQAQNAMSQAQDTATQFASQAGDTAGQFANQAQDTAAQLANQAQYQAQRAGNELERLIHERPLAVGLGAMAIGLAVGLALPETPQENEWMGETRETLMDRAQNVAQDTAQKVTSVAGQTLDAAKEAAQQTAQQAAQEQGLTGSKGQSSDSGQPQQVEFTPEASVDTASDLTANEPTQPQPASRSTAGDSSQG